MFRAESNLIIDGFAEKLAIWILKCVPDSSSKISYVELFVVFFISRARYSLGVALLDKNNPEYVLYRSEEPILSPVEDYERFGKVPNVVFSCGNVLRDEHVLVYYGGADSVLCVATFDLAELLPKK